ncbi:MAG: hypothetical protein GXY83_16640 [Rhodopirellula sp.]|nr:hypothetical protein [Rhodopirellula sp.]
MASESLVLAVADGCGPLAADDIDRVVDYVFAHRSDAIRAFLREEGLRVSGNKEGLQVRIREAIDDGTIDASSLVNLLDTVEGWGNQHIYLYQSPDGETNTWKKETQARKRLKKIGQEQLFNRRRPLVLPDEPTLSAVEWTRDRVRFIWVEKREWELRRSDLDPAADGNGIHFKAYEDKIARGITSFDWNLATGEAALMIQRLPSGERYDDIRQRYEETIEDAVHVSNFTRRDVRKAIRKIEESKETSKRQVAIETQRGGRASFTSKGRKADVFDDPDLKKSRKAMGQTASVLGNFYWLEASPHLERRLHVKLYATDQRVAIFGECSETEVKYVLSRVCHHCQ